MNQPKNNRNLFIKTIAAILLAVVVSFSPLGHEKAHAWLSIPAAIIGSSYKSILEVIQKIAEGVALSQAKMQAIKKISGEVGSMASGSSSGNSKFITDWKEFLVVSPDKASRLYMNDYISSYFQGQGSSNYISASGSSGGGNYARQMQEALKKIYQNKAPENSKLDFGKYNPDTGKISSISDISKVMLNSKNNIFGTYLNMQDKYQQVLQLNTDLVRTMGTAYQGYLPTMSSGKVTTPGINIKDLVSNTQNMSNEAIVNAQDVWSVLSTLASKQVSQYMEQGIGKAQSNAQQESGSTTQKQNNQNFNNVNTNGPGTLFGNQ